MFALLEYNKNYQKNLDECKKQEITPIILFKITLQDKNKTKQDIEKIRKLKQELNPKYTAIQIQIDKLENSSQNTINQLKQEFDITIGLGGLNKINRFFLENTNIDFLQDPHNSKFKLKIDFIHHFNSGLNHVLCSLAKEKNIAFLTTLNFTSSKPFYIGKDLGRINQNLKFARKYKIPTLINFIIENPHQIKSKIELNAIHSLFDISTQQKQQSQNILETKIKENQKKKTKEYICEGIEFEK